MSKKLYTLISTIVGALAAMGSAVVAYCQPHYAVAIIASIGIAATAINDILLQFVEENQFTKKK